MKKALFGFFGVFLCAAAYSANLPTGAQVEVVSDFSGGLNTTSPRHKIPKNFSPNMLNVNISRVPGQINKRNGFVLVGGTTSLQNGRLMFTFNHEDGSTEFIVSDDSQVFTTRDFNLYTFISSGLNNSVHLCAIQARNKVWFSNGVNSVFTWDINGVKQVLDGTLGTPNVPKFRYLVYYQERVFGFNTAVNASQLQWSDLSSTGGAAIAPDNFLAWPVFNALNIGAGDGTVGTSLWLYRGQLQVGKERSIYTLYGTNSSNYFARKTEAQAGVSSNESVVVLDGLTNYKGYDGIYAYDGQTSKRISDDIIPNVQAINDSPNSIINNTWETQADFLRGYFFGSTATPIGFLQIQTISTGTNVANNNKPVVELGDAFIQFSSTGSYLATDFVVRVPTASLPSDFLGYVSAVKVLCRNLDGNFDLNVQMSVSKVGTGETSTTGPTNIPRNSPDFSLRTWGKVNENQDLNVGNKILFTSSEIAAGRLALKFTAQDTGSTLFQFYPATTTGFARIELEPATTVQFLSDISTLSTITAWSGFDSQRNTSGGSILYFLRTSTSLVNIATKTWTAIAPGVVIGDPVTNNFVQWAATITAPTNATNIDNVTISHIEGSASRDRPFAIDWKNEYWLSVATETTGMFSIQYVKSLVTNPNPTAWQQYQGINIRSFCKDSANTLYGGSASTGAFYRLDFGTNDNGLPIDAFYETADLTLRGGMSGGAEGNWMEESIHEIWFDSGPEAGNTTQFGISANGGSYVDSNVSLTGATRVLQVINTYSKFGKYFAFRVRNNQLDKGLFVNNMACVYVPQQTR